MLKCEFFFCWMVVILTVVAGETGLIPNGLYAVKGSPAEFYLNVANILLVIVFVPLALKLFSLNTQRGLRRMDKDEALQSYHLWSIVRLSFLLVCAEAGLISYYLVQDPSDTGLFCACVAMVASFLCYPSINKVVRYMVTRGGEVVEGIGQGE